MLNKDLQALTVIQLRKLAREKGVKLSAGIDKDGIVERLADAFKDLDLSELFIDGSPVGSKPTQRETEPKETEPKEVEPKEAGPKEAGAKETEPKEVQEEKLQGSPLAADVTVVGPSASAQPWRPRPEQGSGETGGLGRQPVYRQAWQARPQLPRQAAAQPSWQQPRAAASPSRFGPPVNYVQTPSAPSAPSVPERQEEPRLSAEAPRPEPVPKLDGYRLGYRAAPQRQTYHRPEGSRQDFRSPYRPEQGSQRGYAPSPYQPPRSNDVEYYNDSLYKPIRDPAFTGAYDPAMPLPELLRTGEALEASGVLEILPDGYGFLRADTLLPGKKDIYVSVAQIRRYGLRTGDFIEGKARPQRDSDKFAALLYVERLNGLVPEESNLRQTFESLIPIYPNRRIVLESEQNSDNMPIRLVDLIAPIGFGQRAMIIAPPESGRIYMLKEIGKAIKLNDPDAHVMMLMVDAAPEEVTEIREAIEVEVFASTFAESPESQTRVSETMLESAQRLVEDGRNVVILLDSLTKLTRAYQAAVTQGGRALTNTVTPAALVRPKRFFGMARNTREGGSLTIIATIAIETGSRVDDIIFEEFKGTANMELRLCAPAPNDPIFPLIDLQLSGTKKEDSLLSAQEKEGLKAIRTVLGSTTNREAVVQLVDMMRKTKCNADLFSRLKDWIALWEKSGFLTARRN
ncbi:MAG: transcription termination factor Rho [Candidatus Limiplasma sp.]|nr:transcription termination factor Rho [Candidatus Limiplasma sp.]